MKILVTGAGGYLAKGIIEELVNMNQTVVAAGPNLSALSNELIKIEGDIFEPEDPFKFYGEPDIVLHLAWRDGFIHNSHSHFEDLSKHTKFMEKLFSSKVKKIAVMGTMHEIGFYEGSIDEWTQPHPMNYYGIAKDSLRNFVSFMSQNTGKQFQWLRAFYIVGNTDSGSSIFSKIVKSEKNGEKIFPFTMGKNQYDFLDYEIFVKKVAITIIQNEVNGVINICSGEPVKLSERVEQFISDNKFKIKLKYGSYPDRKYDSKATWGNSEKIEYIVEKYSRCLRENNVF